MIEIKHTQAALEDLNIIENHQLPYVAISQYWQGTREELQSYYAKHNIVPNFKSENIDELFRNSKEFLSSLVSVLHDRKPDIGKFDSRIVNALTNANTNKDFEIGDFWKLEFDVEDSRIDELTNKFLNAKSRSLLDFRKFDGNKLILIYNRRGMYDEGSRIALLKAKTNVTLTDKFEKAKDNNYISSGIIKELAAGDNDIHFIHKYEKREGVEGIREATGQQINNINEEIETNNKQAARTEAIRQEAKEELKKESMINRDSLKPDSNYEILNNVSNTQVVLDTSKVAVDSSTNSLDDVKEQIKNIHNDSKLDYKERKRALLDLQLEKADKEADLVYRDVKGLIAEGKPVNEAINIVTGKYRDKETLEMGLLELNKDLLEVGLLEKLVVKKDSELAAKEEELIERNENITKREETISSLKSTLTTKENDFRLKEEKQQEKHQEELTLQAQESEKMIKEVTDVAYAKINSLESDIKATDELVIRLSEKNKIYESDLVENSRKIAEKEETIITLNKSNLLINSELDNREKDLARASNLLEEKETELVKAKNTIASSENLISDLTADKEKESRKVIELTEKLNNKDVDLSNKDETIKILEEKVNKLQGLLAQADNHHKDELKRITTEQNEKIEKVEENSEKLLKFLEKLDIMSVDKKDTASLKSENVDNNERVSDILNKNREK